MDINPGIIVSLIEAPNRTRTRSAYIASMAVHTDTIRIPLLNLIEELFADSIMYPGRC